MILLFSSLAGLSGVGTVNLARNKPAVASSLESGLFPAAAAFDGNATTRWSSAFSDPQWIYVDLGANYIVNRVKLRWEGAYATAFKIQASDDVVTWVDIYSTTTGLGGIQDLSVTPTTARYIRMYGTVRRAVYGHSLWEMEVYGPVTGTITSIITSVEDADAGTATTNLLINAVLPGVDWDDDGIAATNLLIDAVLSGVDSDDVGLTLANLIIDAVLSGVDSDDVGLTLANLIINAVLPAVDSDDVGLTLANLVINAVLPAIDSDDIGLTTTNLVINAALSGVDSDDTGLTTANLVITAVLSGIDSDDTGLTTVNLAAVLKYSMSVSDGLLRILLSSDKVLYTLTTTDY